VLNRYDTTDDCDKRTDGQNRRGICCMVLEQCRVVRNRSNGRVLPSPGLRQAAADSATTMRTNDALQRSFAVAFIVVASAAAAASSAVLSLSPQSASSSYTRGRNTSTGVRTARSTMSSFYRRDHKYNKTCNKT